jgi:hypothetical protein
MEKYRLVQVLNAILDDTSNSPDIKSTYFYSKIQEINKDLLKKHREPYWMLFKKTALFLLVVTLVVALVDLID